ncbi:hypothetical protein C8R42DRAFT_598140 [Lentinula raphanica]|nr:hypothetical protein C8R42DRAFT_598140 [Lentinula raphanica]
MQEESDDNVDKSGWPKWVSDAYDALMAEHLLSDNLWVTTIQAWAALERNYEFSNPIGTSATFPATGRPSVVSWWFRNRKPVLRGPPDNLFGEVSEFSAEWWIWWSMINPTWRERDNATGRLVINESDDGDWSMLNRPGQCGILVVLMCLFWWRQRLPAPSQDWTSALQDVSWVINGLFKANK